MTLAMLIECLAWGSGLGVLMLFLLAWRNQ